MRLYLRLFLAAVLAVVWTTPAPALDLVERHELDAVRAELNSKIEALSADVGAPDLPALEVQIQALREAVENLPDHAVDIEALRDRLKLVEDAIAQGPAPDPDTQPDPDPAPNPDPAPTPDPDPAPTPDPDPIPDPPTHGTGPAQIAAVEPGRGTMYGDPWDDINVGNSRNFCGRKFSAIMGAWTSGVVDDDGNLWMVSPGGHSDGCDQSVYKYNIDTGRAETVIEHVPHTHTPPVGNWATLDASGELLQPRSGHNYNGIILIEDLIYYSANVGFPKGQTHHKDNWTISLADPAYVRAADDRDLDAGLLAYLADVPSPDDTGVPGTVVSARGWSFCERNIATGTNSNCTRGEWSFDLVSGQLYGRGDTVWAHGAKKNQGFGFLKIKKIGGKWTEVGFARTAEHSSGPVQVPPEWRGGKAGACIVPTPNGDVPIFLGDGADLLAWKPDGTFQVLPFSNGPGPKNHRRIYGKWGYAKDRGVCVGADRTSNGVFVYRPDAAALAGAGNPPAPSPPQPTPPEPVPGSGAIEPSTGGEVVFAEGFEGQTVWGEGGTPTDGCGDLAAAFSPACGWEEAYYAEREGDPLAGPSIEDGRLVFRLPRGCAAPSCNVHSSRAGLLAINWANGDVAGASVGDRLQIAFDWRASCSVIYLDCDPASPTFKTERRAFAALPSGTTGFKLSIIGTGNTPGQRPVGSCSALEMVTVHGADHALGGYTNCGWFAGFDEPSERQTEPIPVYGYGFNKQPGGDGACHTNWGRPEHRMGWGSTFPDCILLDADTAYRVTMEIDIGAWQPTKDGPPRSRVKIWLENKDAGWRKTVISSAFYISGPRLPHERYGKAWLLPYFSHKDPSEDHPPGEFHYDNVVIMVWRGVVPTG